MGRDPDAWSAICRHWMGETPLVVLPHESVGLSGAPVFAVTAAADSFILKPFGERTPRRHADWVHGLMRHCRAAGVTEVPTVICRDDGTSILEKDGCLWELVERVPGRAVPRPTAAQLAAAARVLARIHRAAASLPGDGPRRGRSPGMDRRVSQARRLLSRPWTCSDAGCDLAAVADRMHRASAIVSGGQAVGIARAAAVEPPPLMLQPVLRDVWYEHVLFVGDRVAGVVDWHAAGIDTPATDIARLVGSWPLDAWARETFIAAYETERPLTAEERDVIPFLQAAGVVCAVDHWFRWMLEEGRTFADMPRVLARLDGLIAALPGALADLAAVGGDARPKLD